MSKTAFPKLFILHVVMIEKKGREKGDGDKVGRNLVVQLY